MGSYIDSAPHFHIRWTGKPNLDWECFATQDEAREYAQGLALDGEAFTIEEVDAKCPLREKMRRGHIAEPERQYPDSSE